MTSRRAPNGAKARKRACRARASTGARFQPLLVGRGFRDTHCFWLRKRYFRPENREKQKVSKHRFMKKNNFKKSPFSNKIISKNRHYRKNKFQKSMSRRFFKNRFTLEKQISKIDSKSIHIDSACSFKRAMREFTGRTDMGPETPMNSLGEWTWGQKPL